MRTFSRVKGMLIYDIASGNKIGRILDFCIEEPGQLKGLIMDGKGIFHRQKLLPFEYIQSFGEDGVMVDKHLLTPISKEKGQVYFHHYHGIKGKSFMTGEGQNLGLLEDVYFDEETGTIVGYEVTDGFFADFVEGKKIIRNPSDLIIGKDTVVVSVIT
ncbi:PRC-barrel domain protein [Bacillus sp. THAF10]|uniref:PRC-barrel domain-containing protein n=1 Tax=Bacillus sp. THAF10 TaxID=2587848 RepID=UPI0012692139|nr:PRC-barrel domain-containing protein [Bacillus sp. THAF10]QFT89986.1 PRC-barrel domain protein [Bacillus sp. THAF10]